MPSDRATAGSRPERTAPSRKEGILSIVGTPIGNLDDISERVISTLSGADAVLAEDTRVSGKLMARFGIRVPLERCDENVIRSRADAIAERIRAGERIAFVSDAGMPCISDPGQVLVDTVREAGLPVEVIPGPSAVSSAIAASGLDAARFYFGGFLPRKAGELRRTLEALSRLDAALVFYESPRRVQKSLEAIAEAFPARRVALCRELTKLHEEVLRGTASELIACLEGREALKGECVLVIEAPRGDEPASLEVDGSSIEEAIGACIKEGIPTSAAAKRIARAFGIARDEAYARVLAAMKDAQQL